MSTDDVNAAALGAATPGADIRQARNQVAAAVEAVSRLHGDLRDRLPDAAHHLDLALGDLLDAYDVAERAIAAQTQPPGRQLAAPP
ncbi:MAG: hypothetical protein ACRCYX_08390 [Dermatophilaceae bacterium]